jgi:hypothetical protein
MYSKKQLNTVLQVLSSAGDGAGEAEHLCQKQCAEVSQESITMYGLHALQHSLQETLCDLPSLTALSRCIQGM